MAIGRYDALKIEPEVLSYWEKKKIYAKAKQNGKDFYFLDGPPYTSGKVHIGTAWNKSLKDCFLRFKRMSGFNIWDRAGYDMHGLPTEHATEKKLGIKNKDEIPKFGIAKFVEECRKLSLHNLKLMNEDFKRMGVWMDFENAYQSIDPMFIDGEWWLIKKAHENKRLYEGEKVMHWCSSCATALAKHELEYKTVMDDSIFLKFKIKDNQYLIIWTTTPWTIPFNLAVMVNPEAEYVKAQVGEEVWIVAAALAGVFIQGVADKPYEVIETIKGESLDGIEYVHPLYDELKEVYDKLKKESPRVHTIILSKEYVDTTSGSGLVHCAPGCGPEDYEMGHKYGIPPLNTLDEKGAFPEEMSVFKNWIAKQDDPKFIDFFQQKGCLIASNPVEHEYAHCWRCHKPVIFRTTRQWFFKVEDLKERMRELNRQVDWQPDWAGNKQFDAWLDNLRDNGITRQRYWGTPIPIWRCDKCRDYVVVGSIKELEELSGQTPDKLHIPWIDEIMIKCTNCDTQMKRVPDILDVWVDAGTNSWTCLNYPAQTEDFDRLWPADFILEGKDQIRGWFNLLLVCSMVSMDKHSYKSVYMHGFVNDAQGRKMSKSLGNYILPEEVISKYGADTLRYYSIGGANPGYDLNYNFDDMKLKHANLMVLWNVHKFLIDLGNPKEGSLGIEERYILSSLHTTIEKVTHLFNEHKLNEVPLAVEKLFLDLSRTYIQLVRDKSSVGSEEDKQVVAHTLYTVLIECLKLFSPIAPFITEAIYLNLKDVFGLEKESIHLYEWPKADKKMIDSSLEQDMFYASQVIQGILSGREKLGQGVRWPLKEVIVITANKGVEGAVEKLGDIIKRQTNVKEIRVQESLAGVKEIIKADYSKMGPAFKEKAAEVIAHLSMHSPETILKRIKEKGKYEIEIKGETLEVTKEHLLIERKTPGDYVEVDMKHFLLYLNPLMDKTLETEGYAREVMRRVQSLRKEAGLRKQDDIVLFIKADEGLAPRLQEWENQIQQRCGAKKMKISDGKPARKHEFVHQVKIKKYSFEICFDKV